MGERSVIEWTDATWNPWRGCDKVSPGCAHCYMFRDQRRYGRDPSVVVRASDATFFAPLRSRRWQAPRKVFTCSWSDWFHEDADPWRAEAWDVIRRTPEHTYQVLTKRPERIADHLPDDWGDGYANVWLGVTIESRRFVDRADLLRETPAAVRFISAEPLLGPLVCGVCGGTGWDVEPGSHGQPVQVMCPECMRLDGDLDLAGIDWLIAGGESGSRPGRMLVERDDAGRWVPKVSALGWVRDLRDACERAETAFLFKQWGGPRPTSGGRLLDGRTWDEMPTPRPVEVER
jgi:protein gp37